jgi:ABC-2 type transport system ATP-binding protein
MQGLPGIESIRDLGSVQELRLARGFDPQFTLRALIDRTRVESFTVARPSLDDIFVRIAGPEVAKAQHA